MGYKPRDPADQLKQVVGERQSAFGYFRRQKISNPIAALATRLKTAQATSNSVTTTVTSFTAQPDVPRIVSVTPGGTTNDVPAGDVTVNGKNGIIIKNMKK